MRIRKTSILVVLTILVVCGDRMAEWGVPLIGTPGFKHLAVVFGVVSIIWNEKISIPIVNLLVFLLIIIYVLYQGFFTQTRGWSTLVSSFFTFFPLLIALIAGSTRPDEQTSLKLASYLVHTLILLALPSLALFFLGYDIRINPGLHREAGSLGSTMVACLGLSSYLYLKGSQSRNLFFAHLALILLVLSALVLKKNLLTFLIFITYWAFYLREKISSKAIFVALSVAAVFLGYVINPLLLNIAKNATYLENVGAEGHIRLAMYITAFRINIDTLGLGSGLGSFGSLGALVGDISASGIRYELSEVYEEYGISSIAGNSAEKLNSGEAGTLLDTFWPHIIGELGVLGSLLFITFIFLHLNFSRAQVFLSLVIVSLYLDGFFLIIPESPLFALISIFFPIYLMKSVRPNESAHHYNIGR